MKALFFLLALATAAPALAQEGPPKVQARLVAEGAVAPGGSVIIALEEVIAPEWHTYWKNPGDAGAPTSVSRCMHFSFRRALLPCTGQAARCRRIR